VLMIRIENWSDILFHSYTLSLAYPLIVCQICLIKIGLISQICLIEIGSVDQMLNWLVNIWWLAVIVNSDGEYMYIILLVTCINPLKCKLFRVMHDKILFCTHSHHHIQWPTSCKRHFVYYATVTFSNKTLNMTYRIPGNFCGT